MNIDAPRPETLPDLKVLWQEAFGDTDEYLNLFFSVAYAPEHCRCLWENGQLASSLYWFDCTCQGQKLAYLYGVATGNAFRHRGLASHLIRHTLMDLKASGYAGAILVPAEPSLFRFYEQLGFTPATRILETEVSAAGSKIPVSPITAASYFSRRDSLLPRGSVLQHGVIPAFLHTQALFYQSNSCIFCAVPDGEALLIRELLGDTDNLPGILAFLGYAHAQLRVPGDGRCFTMYCPLRENAPVPDYFGFALD